MLQVAKRQTLTVIRKRENGVYLAGEDTEDAVLLPKAEAGSFDVGDSVEVYIYKDSEDRNIATVKQVPEAGTVAMLKITQISRIGAFLDWGLLKELFLPYAEQRGRPKEGMSVPVIIYVDKSGRPAASMHVYSRLSTASPYHKDDVVSGMIYEIKDIGIFVAVDGMYAGMIPRQETYGEHHVGEMIEARVLNVRPDGKLDLSPRKKTYEQMDDDAARIMEALRSYDGELPFGEKAEPEVIKDELGLSKNAFKRAVGRLLKDGLVKTGPDRITALSKLDKQ